jgi:hypothetical protein
VGADAVAYAFQSIGGYTQSIPALDDTDLSNATYHSKVRGDLIDIGPIECTIFYDPDTPPAITTVAQSWVLSFPAHQTHTVPAKITGTGFITESGSPELVNNELMMGTFTLQWDGQTGPTLAVANTP